MSKEKIDASKLAKYFEAAAKNDLATVKHFIEEEKIRASTITKGDRETAAHIAAKNGHLDIIRYLVEKSPTITNVADAYGYTIIFRAIDKGALDIVKYLIDECKEKVFQQHRRFMECTTVSSAIEFDHLDILKYFFEEKGVDVNVLNSVRESPVFISLRFKRHSILKYLVEERNANLTMCDANNDNILYKTVVADDLPSMKYILDERKAEFDINWQNEFGYTLVHRACTFQRFSILKYLVDEKHADIHVREDENMTALHFAASKNNHDICRYLIEHGANVQAVDNCNETPNDKATDPQLKEYIKSVPISRNCRSVHWPVHSAIHREAITSQLIPSYLPHMQLTDKSATSFYSTMDRTSYSNNLSLSQFHGFLIPILVMVSTVTGDGHWFQEWTSQDPRTDPVAVDVVNSLRNPFAEK